MKSRQLNVAYTVFNKIVVEKEYNTAPIFKYFTGNSSSLHFDSEHIDFLEFMAALIVCSYSNYISKLKRILTL